jgi:predicted site-specific integrase-resolvase
VIVAGLGGSTDDLVGDMIEVFTLMCAWLCGRRGAGSRVVCAVHAAGSAGMDAAV